jgi:hypothetical protein
MPPPIATITAVRCPTSDDRDVEEHESEERDQECGHD